MFLGKKVYDVTRPIQDGMTVWSGDDQVTLERVLSIQEGGAANISRIKMGVHTGTHMDAPLHFIDGGDDIEGMSLDRLFGEVLVIEVTDGVIDESQLSGHSLNDIHAVFFKTTLSERDEMAPFLEEYPGITKNCAMALTKKGIRIVGTDYFSIEFCTDNCFPVHKFLLSHKIGIVENLCLKGIAPGRYSYVCLPLKIKGSDGAPCRVLLYK